MPTRLGKRYKGAAAGLSIDSSLTDENSEYSTTGQILSTLREGTGAASAQPIRRTISSPRSTSRVCPL